MNRQTCILATVVVAIGLWVGGCDGLLEPDVHSELVPGNFLQTKSGMESALVATYSQLELNSYLGRTEVMALNDFTTDIADQEGGGYESRANPFLNFTWDPSNGTLTGIWSRLYRAIRNANTVLDNIDQAEFDEEEVQKIEAEARFLRATAYTRLYYKFGPVPLVTTARVESDFEKSRATEEEMRTFIEEEFREAASSLPLTQSQYGRATKGAALGMLTKFLLQTRQWQKAADAANSVIDLGEYGLYEDRFEMWHVNNEQNKEFIWVNGSIREPGQGNPTFSTSLPPNYKYKYPPNENFPANFMLRPDFAHSLHPDDVRRKLIIYEYENQDGEIVEPTQPFPKKYREDPSATDRWAGNDIPEVRYADILLALAEARNELMGPNQESVELINRIRELNEVPLLELNDIESKEELRDLILRERAWEFFMEGKRRRDLIRHGRFIEQARSRGIDAAEHQVRFPIPQVEIDANPAISQNPGY